MSESPTLRKTILMFWFFLGGILIAQGIAYTIGSIPVFAGATLIAPALIEYLIVAWIGWLALYAIDTVGLLRYVDVEKLLNFFDQLNTSQWFMFLFITTYVNVVLLAAGALGLATSSLIGIKAAGLIVAILYPNLDLRLAREYPTPGRLSIMAFLALFHAFGVLRDISTENVVSGIERKPTV